MSLDTYIITGFAPNIKIFRDFLKIFFREIDNGKRGIFLRILMCILIIAKK